MATTPNFISVDGGTAAAMGSFPFLDTAFLYPITPATTMCEQVNEFATQGKKNLYGNVPTTVELQSEAGVAGSLHGAASAGSLTSTFTCSQGLLLMVPEMYKMAGEMLPVVIHVASRTVAQHCMSLYCDYSDVMATERAGWTMMCSCNPQEAHDGAHLAHIISATTSMPLVHFFDGLRTSHSIHKIVPIPEDVSRQMFPFDKIAQWRNERAISPEHPTGRGCGQDQDLFWLSVTRRSPLVKAIPAAAERIFEQFEQLTGRHYRCVEYLGPQDAEDVLVIMGSASKTVEETVKYWMKHEPQRKVGVIRIRLFRPFPHAQFLAALPASVKRLCVLDRVDYGTEMGEPLYLDVLATLEGAPIRSQIQLVIGGKFGISGTEFNPLCVRTICDNLHAEHPKTRFCVGLNDDLQHTSLDMPLPYPTSTCPAFSTVPEGTNQALFFGFGSDGTVGSVKSAASLICANTDLYSQSHSHFDAKKTGGFTSMHLRFGPEPILSEYEIYESDYTACHNCSFISRFDTIRTAKPNTTYVLNSPWSTLEELNVRIPNSMKQAIVQKKLKFYNIDAAKLARELGLGGHINMIMQACFFSLSGVLPSEKALGLLKDSVVKMYSKKGNAIVDLNIHAIDHTLASLHQVNYPEDWATCPIETPKPFGDAFLDDIYVPSQRHCLDEQAASKIPLSVACGIFPTETAKLEKRGVAQMVPRWSLESCKECNICASVCPHAAIRPFLVDPALDHPIDTFASKPLMGVKGTSLQYRIQVAPLDCLGCGLCVTECPAKALTLRPFEETEETERETKNWEYAMTLPTNRSNAIFPTDSLRDIIFHPPMLEFNGACAGCSEPTYVKLITQLLGSQMVVAAAVGCSMIWGTFTPTCAFTKDEEGTGPAWSSSLFEDNAEFGLGMTVAIQKRREGLKNLVHELLEKKEGLTPELEQKLKDWIPVSDDLRLSKPIAQAIKADLKTITAAPAGSLIAKIKENQDMLAQKSYWLTGGDGWSYDIDFHGLDHVLNSGVKVNILIFDTEVYSNTGGQASKATPRCVPAKLQMPAKQQKKKDLGLYAMSLGCCYVASVAIGANRSQYLRAVMEAERYPGPSLIIGYCPCIAHGMKAGMNTAQQEMKAAVQSGYWPLYRFNPMLVKQGQQPLSIDQLPAVGSNAATLLTPFFNRDARFARLVNATGGLSPEATALCEDIEQRNNMLRKWGSLYDIPATPAAPATH